MQSLITSATTPSTQVPDRFIHRSYHGPSFIKSSDQAMENYVRIYQITIFQIDGFLVENIDYYKQVQ